MLPRPGQLSCCHREQQDRMRIGGELEWAMSEREPLLVERRGNVYSRVPPLLLRVPGYRIELPREARLN